MINDRLAVSVTSNDGRIVRWGGDEPAVEQIPEDLEFSTSMPGGYKDLSCSVFRRLGGDERLFNNVRAYGPGNRTVWEGRLVQFPREDLTVSPSATGWSSHMRDDPSFREIYINRDLGTVQQAGPNRRINALPSHDFQDFRVAQDPDAGVSVLNLGLVGPWNRFTVCEAYIYSVPGGRLGRMRFDWSTPATTVSATDPNWEAAAFTTDRAQATFALGTTDFQGTAQSGTLDYNLTGLPGGEGFMFRWYYLTGPTGSSSTNYDFLVRNFRVYGLHGLTPQGTVPDEGFYGHDIVNDIVERTCPLLNAGIGTGRIEQNTTFAIPQAAFYDPVTADAAVMLINGYFLWEWGVFDDRQFFWRAPDPTRLTWQARLAEGTRVSLEGETADQQFNGVIVRYTDPTGQPRIAGPPAAYWSGGSAKADVTNAALIDTNPLNAINAAGIPRRWGVLTVGPTTTDAGAVQLGAVWLAERRLPQRRGTITVAGGVLHPTEGQVPPWRIRAGDGITVPDLADTTVRRIIETRYTRDTDTLTATVGNPDYKVDAILERIGVELAGVA